MNDSGVGLQGNGSWKVPGGSTGKGFRPGRSGNPSGKRKGCVSLAAALARSLTREDAEEICRKLIALCKDGDMAALKLLSHRLEDLQIEQRIAALEEQVSTQKPPNPT